MSYISIYRWEDAPYAWKKLSTNGGDEDWVVFVPEPLRGEYIPFLEEGRFSNIVDSYEIPGGVVIIGSHA